MAEPLNRKNVYTRIGDNKQGIRKERNKHHMPSPYIYVGDFDTSIPPVVTWQSPVWQNSFTWFGTAYVGFRHGLDGDTEFVGRFDLTQGAVTGTVAFQLPLAYRARAYDFAFPIWTGGTDWITGVLSIEADGHCRVYWPVKAAAI